MYLPYFRCKQNELLAIRESIEILKQSKKKIVPVLEPVRENLSYLKKCVEVLKNNRVPFVLIVNPMVGQLKDDGSNLIIDEIINGKLKNYTGYCLGYIIGEHTKISDVNKFLGWQKKYNKCLIHAYSMREVKELRDVIHRYENIAFNVFDLSECGDKYISEFDLKNKVALRNDFKERTKNALYPEDEYFSDLCFIYESKKFIGYGDYLMVGDSFVETGGPAHVVTIHLIYPQGNREIRIKHFSSDSDRELPINPAGKFKEALTKLVEYLKSNSPFKGNSTYQMKDEFVDLYESDHYPGLGTVKKISMKHHLDIMSHVLYRE